MGTIAHHCQSDGTVLHSSINILPTQTVQAKQGVNQPQLFIRNSHLSGQFAVIIIKMSEPFTCISLVETDQFRGVQLGRGRKDLPHRIRPSHAAHLGLQSGSAHRRQSLPLASRRHPHPHQYLRSHQIAGDLHHHDLRQPAPLRHPAQQLPRLLHRDGLPGYYGRDGQGTVHRRVWDLLYSEGPQSTQGVESGHNKELHFICLLVVFAVTFALYLAQALGPTPYGYCGMRFTNSSAFAGGVLSIAYTVILLVASAFFLHYIRKIESKNQQAKGYLKYYFCFLLLFCLAQLTISTCHIIVASSCLQENNANMFNTARTIASCFAVSSPLFILVIILSNEQNRKGTVVELFRRVVNRFRKWRAERRQEQRRAQVRTSFIQELNSYRNTIGVELVELPVLDSYLGELKNKNRACLLTTLLGCLAIHHIELKNYVDKDLHLRTSAVEEDKDTLFLWNYTEKSYFALTQSLQEHYRHLFIDKLLTLSLEFVAFAPTILHQFVLMDRARNIGEALAPRYNYQEILNDCMNNEGAGGRSGQFFFFNRDRTLILKTVSSTERQVFTDRIQAFHRHFRAHPASLIVKLYSVFTVHAPDLEEHIDFTLMGNILGKVDRKHVLRTYDLKGSTHSREVIKGKERESEEERIEKTLKDVDFERLEGKIWLSPTDRQELCQRLQKDSRFFMEEGLIDYSLIVIKVDMKSLAADKEQEKMLSSLVFYPSTKESKVAYFLGIIDYLETWNLRKRGEKWYKSIFTKAEKISSQDPVFYSNRFINFCHHILTL